MPNTPTARLVDQLQGDAYRNRTGILELPLTWLGREDELAARIGIGFSDIQASLLLNLSPDQRFLGADWRQLITRYFDPLTAGRPPNGGGIILANVDLLTSYLREGDREEFWRFLRQSYRPPWGLLLTLPAANQHLISSDERERWVATDRLVGWNEP
jgi:hypothetical protein